MAHHAGMRFSINIPNFGDFADARKVATLATAAEEAGWDALFVWDHVVHDKQQTSNDLHRLTPVLERINQGPPTL